MKHPFQIVLTSSDGKHLFCTVKNHLQVFSSGTGDLLGSWSDDVNVFDWKQLKENKKALDLQECSGQDKTQEKVTKPVKVPTPGPGAPPMFNYIRSLALSENETHIIGTTDSDKAAIIFKLDFTKKNCLQLIKRQLFPKRPCLVTIDGNKTALVADKFGDVYAVEIDELPAVDEKTLTPILGHVSMLSDIELVHHSGKQFILSGDRDEHIRVSNYPKSYVIKCWLFGHHEFVSSLHVPRFDSDLLISGGGDDYLCVWNWYDEKLLNRVPLRELVEPFLLDSHLPPSRFLKEESRREITIADILTFVVPATQKRILIVLVENTSCIFTFELIDQSRVNHHQTFETNSPIIGLALDSANESLVISKETSSQECSIGFLNFDGEGMILEDASKDQVCTKIDQSNACDVNDSSEFYPLYYINTLRKRSEH